MTTATPTKTLRNEDFEYLVEKEHIARELLIIATGQTNEYPEAREETSLILDREAILAIKTYEKKGLNLPQTEEEVYNFLGNQDSDIQGLTNADLKKSFVAIHDNAELWSPLQIGIMALAAKLDNFSGMTQNEGQMAFNFLADIIIKYSNDPEFTEIDPDRLDDEEYIKEILESLDTEADVAEEEAGMLALTKTFIDLLVNETQVYSQQTNELLEEIRLFQVGLTACSDDIKAKEKLCDDMDLDADIEAKKDELRRQRAILQDLNAEYDKLVGLAFTGAAGGVFGLIITGSIYGAKADQKKKEINQKKKEINELEAEIETLERRLAIINTLDTEFEGLFAVMVQAEKGVQELITVWITINELLEASSRQCENITNAESVLFLLAPFSGALSPWKEVGKNAKAVSQAFQDALDEWAGENRRRETKYFVK